MIKKIFYTLLVVFTCFIGLNKVSAETNRMYMSYDSTLLEIGDTRIVSTTPITITNQITYSDLSTNFDTYSTLYARYSFCSTSDLFSANSQVINTNIKCSNNGSIGTLSFFTMSFNENNTSEGTYNPDTSVSTFIYNTSFDIYSSYTDTLTLYGVDVGRSLSDFPSYDSNSDVLDKLDSLNSSVISNLHNIQNTNEKILLYVLSIYQNMVTCRDSYNLFNINGPQLKVSDFTRIDGNKIIISPVDGNPHTTVFDYIKVSSLEQYTLSFNLIQGTARIGFRAYNSSKEPVSIPIESVEYNSFYGGYYKNSNKLTITIPNGISYIAPMVFAMQGDFDNIYSDYQVQKGSVATSFEPYGEQICKSKVDETNDAINESNKKLDETNNKLQQQQDFMNDDDTSGSSSEAESFFEGFSTNTYGLTSIITAPLELIGNIAGSTCSPLPLQIPFVGGTFNLPCMSSIYKKHFGSFLTVYQTITFGIVAYWVCIRIFALVKDFKNPEHDEIEVMDL